jgi:ubiquinone/menaquinone biosynthesis C-methylase UbiE
MNLKTFFKFRKAYSGQLFWPLILYQRKPIFKQMAIEAAQSLAKGWILDIGTGPASLPMEIAKDCRNVNIVGLDISVPVLNEAIKQIRDEPYSSRIHLITSSAEYLPFADNVFEMVQSMFSLHLWDDLSLAIDEIYRVLEPNSQAIVLVGRQYLLHGLWRWFYFLTDRPTSNLRDMFTRAGFRTVDIKPFKRVNAGLRIFLTK